MLSTVFANVAVNLSKAAFDLIKQTANLIRKKRMRQEMMKKYQAKSSDLKSQIRTTSFVSHDDSRLEDIVASRSTSNWINDTQNRIGDSSVYSNDIQDVPSKKFGTNKMRYLK